MPACCANSAADSYSSKLISKGGSILAPRQNRMQPMAKVYLHEVGEGRAYKRP